MIIKECYIENFGIFRDKPFKFETGLNVIKEDNGWGKSTLAVFIKSMFYSMEYSRKKALTEYRKYEPWQGGKYGGWLVFSANGRDYRVTRYFARKESERVFELYDLSTNKPSDDYGENLGEELFGIDCASFERSIFIKLDSELGKPEMSDSISAKLNNLVDNTDDMNNYETAYTKLDKLASSIVPKRGAGGLVGKIEADIQMLRDEIAVCDKADREITLLSGQISEEKSKAELLNAEIEKLGAAHENCLLFDKKEQYDGMVTRAKALGERCRALSEFFKNGLPSDEEINKCRQDIAEYDKVNEALMQSKPFDSEAERYKEIQQKYNGNPPTTEQADICEEEFGAAARLSSEISEKNAELSELYAERSRQSEKRTRMKTVIAAAFAVLIIIGAVLAVILDNTAVRIASSALAAVGIAGIIAVFAVKKNDGTTEQASVLEAEINSLKQKKGEADKRCADALIGMNPNADTTNILRSLNEIRSDIDDFNDILGRLRRYSAARDSAEKIKSDILPFLNRYEAQGTLSERLQSICYKLNEYERTRAEFLDAKSEIETFESKNDIAALRQAVPPESAPEEISARLNECRSKTSMCERAIAGAEQNMRRCEAEADNRQELESRLAALTERREELTKKNEILRETIELLQRAKENMSTRYMDDMTEAFGKYIKMIEPSRDDIVLTADLDTQIVRGGIQRESGHYSRGYADLVNICTRLALTDVMYKDEKPFLILDDPFVNLDEKKTERALKFIKKIGKEKQEFYFTCHESRTVKEASNV